jgi:hypothetical protein
MKFRLRPATFATNYIKPFLKFQKSFGSYMMNTEELGCGLTGNVIIFYALITFWQTAYRFL